MCQYANVRMCQCEDMQISKYANVKNLKPET